MASGWSWKEDYVFLVKLDTERSAPYHPSIPFCTFKVHCPKVKRYSVIDKFERVVVINLLLSLFSSRLVKKKKKKKKLRRTDNSGVWLTEFPSVLSKTSLVFHLSVSQDRFERIVLSNTYYACNCYPFKSRINCTQPHVYFFMFIKG